VGGLDVTSPPAIEITLYVVDTPFVCTPPNKTSYRCASEKIAFRIAGKVAGSMPAVSWPEHLRPPDDTLPRKL
jgi:hypothetical protein